MGDDTHVRPAAKTGVALHVPTHSHGARSFNDAAVAVDRVHQVTGHLKPLVQALLAEDGGEGELEALEDLVLETVALESQQTATYSYSPGRSTTAHPHAAPLVFALGTGGLPGRCPPTCDKRPPPVRSARG